jgi:hypothetical protein
MTIVKRCEKEVEGSWTDKQRQAVQWLDRFVPHYRGLCVSGDGCPAKHIAASDQRQPVVGIEKRFIDGKDPQDEEKIAALEELIEKMKTDVTMFVHGYHTCWVESSHNERAVYTSKRVEVWRNFRGKGRLVQLFHNHGVEKTAEMVRQHLGWQVTEEVREQWRKIDRDKAKHREIKADPSYNRRQREIALERQARKVEVKTVAKSAAKEEKRRERERMKAGKGKEEKTRKVVTVAHTYNVRKRPLYADVRMMDGKEEKRGSRRKRKADEMDASSADKENTAGEENRILVDAVTGERLFTKQVMQELNVIMSESSSR